MQQSAKFVGGNRQRQAEQGCPVGCEANTFGLVAQLPEAFPLRGKSCQLESDRDHFGRLIYSVKCLSFKELQVSDSNYSLREACWIVLGGVGAISPILYDEALHKISEMTGRVIDEQFRRDVTDILRTFPCPLD